jgi:hypothetical protein
MALLPPPAGAGGSWQDARDGERTVSRFFGHDGKLRGFGISHPTPALRLSLMAELAGV